jgi:hypothetical protein
MKQYILRNIDPDLWRETKARAALDGKPVRHILLDMLRYYADHGLPWFSHVGDEYVPVKDDRQ